MMVNAVQVERKLPIGRGSVARGGVHFRVLLKCKQVEVVVVPAGADGKSGMGIPLSAEEHGYFSGVAADARAGTLYGFRLNGGDPMRPIPSRGFSPISSPAYR